VSFSVEPGEIVAVVGPNGVGKSTLIKAVSGVIQLSSGSIEIQRSALERMSPAERARLVSVVPQAALLPGGYTVRDVVLMGRTPYLGWLERESAQDIDIVDRAMGQTEIEELADRLVGELSGGEQQRVLIARALAQDSPVMLLDEPTAHLDLRHQDRLLDLIRRLVRDHALGVLAAIHDLNLVARLADRVILLSDGTIKKRGKPADVLTPEELEAVYGIQIHVTTHPLDGGPLVLTGR
jgi:iron complex transport system ATP-binding protein